MPEKQKFGSRKGCHFLGKGPGGGGGGTPLYKPLSHLGMCRPKGYGFWALLV